MAATKFSLLLIAFLCLFSIQIYIVESGTLKSEAHTFKSLLQSLKQVKKGQTADGLDDVKKYLRRFGYYPNIYTNLTNHFDDLLESALQKYQRFFGLKVTGKLDSKTIKQLTTPRCGLPDIITNHTSSESRLFGRVPNYAFPKDPTVWIMYDLTYGFNSGVDSPHEQDMRAACSRSFETWQMFSALTFKLASDGDPSDIVIGFFRGDHGDGQPFDRPNILGHAFYPEDGRLHFNADQNWSADYPGPDEIDLESVALHEIGHVIGLAHSQDPDAVMFPSTPLGVIKRDLSQDDRDGIEALYVGVWK